MHRRIVGTAGGAPRPLRAAPGVYTGFMNPLREELAAVAARLVVEDGLDYASAKRKALHQLLGPGVRSDAQPDNDDVRAEVERYLAVFHGDTHPRLLWRLRAAALELMREFEPFRPYVAGAVWNGTATEHSGLHLLLFCDDPKEVEIHCINRGIRYATSQGAHYAGRRSVERLEFLWPLPGENGSPELVLEATLSLYPPKDERGVLVHGGHGARGASPERGSLQALRNLVEAGPGPAP